MDAVHMSGAGNDFIVLDARGMGSDFSGLAMTLCKRYGADGLLALDVSEIADFKLHFYNPDGSRGEMCGNGARCICRFAYDRGLAGETMTVETDAGLVYGWRLGENRYRVQLNNPSCVIPECVGNAAYVELGDPGIPHSVTEFPTLQWEDRQRLLPQFLALRNSGDFPKGVNVNFFRVLGEDTVRMLTFERGVEDFTLACGTGSASVAVYLYLSGRLPGGHLIAENPGGRLDITVTGKNGKVTELYLEGAADVLKSIEI